MTCHDDYLLHGLLQKDPIFSIEVAISCKVVSYSYVVSVVLQQFKQYGDPHHTQLMIMEDPHLVG